MKRRVPCFLEIDSNGKAVLKLDKSRENDNSSTGDYSSQMKLKNDWKLKKGGY